jgi:hypothetical protein
MVISSGWAFAVMASVNPEAEQGRHDEHHEAGSFGQQGARVVSARIYARVALIAAHGRVLGDSEHPESSLENHAGRPEIPLTSLCV